MLVNRLWNAALNVMTSAALVAVLGFSSVSKGAGDLDQFAPLIDKALDDSSLNYEVRLWFQKLHDGDLRDATHRWSTVRNEISRKHRYLADAVYTVALKELGLTSTMMSQLIQTTS